MKPLHITYTTAVLAAVLFVYEVFNIVQLNAEAVALESKIDNYNGWSHLLSLSAESFYEGFIGNVPGIISLSEQEAQAADDLNAAKASLISRYGDAVQYRNDAVVVFLVSLGCGYCIRRIERKQKPVDKAAQMTSV